MASLDDLPLDPGRGDAAQRASSAPSSPGSRVVLPAVLVALVLGAGIWYYGTRQREKDEAAAASTDAPAVSAAALSEPAPVAADLPPRDAMDPYVRALFATLGSHPELLKWLATDDLVGAIATALDRLAQGQSPARDLAVLRPAQSFAVARGSNVTRVDAATYARYGPLVAAMTTVDPAALATAFSTIRPRLDEAYRAQGHPDGGFDEAVRKAIEMVASTPDLPPDAALVPGVGGYAYANPAFERLPAAQKHVLRMGPDHARQVREAARRFGAALAAQTSAAAAR